MNLSSRKNYLFYLIYTDSKQLPLSVMLNFSILLHWFKFAIAVFYAV
jgi:hypothetical protein